MNGTTPRTFVIYLREQPSVTHQVVSLLRRRMCDIVSLSVGRTHESGRLQMTIVVEADAHAAQRLEANLNKLVDILRVDDITEQAAVCRELALVKLRPEQARRARLMSLCEELRASVIESDPEFVLIECTGGRESIDESLSVLHPFGIVEVVRTGAVAMSRSSSTRESSA